MRNSIYITLLSTITFFSWFNFIQAANPLDAVINEIAWMGTEASYNDEWVELYNNTDAPINLEGWTLKSTDDTPEILLSEIIPADGFYLLERTDDNTISDIEASQIYTGALENGGELLQLIDSQGNIIDEINCVDGWFGGDNTIKATMERKDVLGAGSDIENWDTNNGQIINGKDSAGNDILGTPKQQNSVYLITSGPPPQEEPSGGPTSGTTEEPLPEDNPDIQPEPLPQNDSPPAPESEPQQEQIESPPEVIYSDKIFINEIYPNTLGADSEEEWIEVYNDSEQDISLENWQLDDQEGGSFVFIIPEDTTISTKSYLVFYRNKTGIALNNEGDEVRLFQPDRTLTDSVSYPKTTKGRSYNKNSDGFWVWSATLTPGNSNYINTQTDTDAEQTDTDTNITINSVKDSIDDNMPRDSSPLDSSIKLGASKTGSQNDNKNEVESLQAEKNTDETLETKVSAPKSTTQNLESNIYNPVSENNNSFWWALIIGSVGIFTLLSLKYFLKKQN